MELVFRDWCRSLLEWAEHDKSYNLGWSLTVLLGPLAFLLGFDLAVVVFSLIPTVSLVSSIFLMPSKASNPLATENPLGLAEWSNWEGPPETVVSIWFWYKASWGSLFPLIDNKARLHLKKDDFLECKLSGSETKKVLGASPPEGCFWMAMTCLEGDEEGRSLNIFTSFGVAGVRASTESKLLRVILLVGSAGTFALEALPVTIESRQGLVDLWPF